MDKFYCQFNSNAFGKRFSLEKRLVWQEGAPENGEIDPKLRAALEHELSYQDLAVAIGEGIDDMLKDAGVRTRNLSTQLSSGEITLSQKVDLTLPNNERIKLTYEQIKGYGERGITDSKFKKSELAEILTALFGSKIVSSPSGYMGSDRLLKVDIPRGKEEKYFGVLEMVAANLTGEDKTDLEEMIVHMKYLHGLSGRRKSEGRDAVSQALEALAYEAEVESGQLGQGVKKKAKATAEEMTVKYEDAKKDITRKSTAEALTIEDLIATKGIRKQLQEAYDAKQAAKAKKKANPGSSRYEQRSIEANRKYRDLTVKLGTQLVGDKLGLPTSIKNQMENLTFGDPDKTAEALRILVETIHDGGRRVVTARTYQVIKNNYNTYDQLDKWFDQDDDATVTYVNDMPKIIKEAGLENVVTPNEKKQMPGQCIDAVKELWLAAKARKAAGEDDPVASSGAPESAEEQKEAKNYYEHRSETQLKINMRNDGCDLNHYHFIEGGDGFIAIRKPEHGGTAVEKPLDFYRGATEKEVREKMRVMGHDPDAILGTTHEITKVDASNTPWGIKEKKEEEKEEPEVVAQLSEKDRAIRAVVDNLEGAAIEAISEDWADLPRWDTLVQPLTDIGLSYTTRQPQNDKEVQDDDIRRAAIGYTIAIINNDNYFAHLANNPDEAKDKLRRTYSVTKKKYRTGNTGMAGVIQRGLGMPTQVVQLDDEAQENNEKFFLVLLDYIDIDELNTATEHTAPADLPDEAFDRLREKYVSGVTLVADSGSTDTGTSAPPTRPEQRTETAEEPKKLFEKDRPYVRKKKEADAKYALFTMDRKQERPAKDALKALKDLREHMDKIRSRGYDFLGANKAEVAETSRRLAECEYYLGNFEEAVARITDAKRKGTEEPLKGQIDSLAAKIKSPAKVKVDRGGKELDLPNPYSEGSEDAIAFDRMVARVNAGETEYAYLPEKKYRLGRIEVEFTEGGALMVNGKLHATILQRGSNIEIARNGEMTSGDSGSILQIERIVMDGDKLVSVDVGIFNEDETGTAFTYPVGAKIPLYNGVDLTVTKEPRIGSLRRDDGPLVFNHEPDGALDLAEVEKQVGRVEITATGDPVAPEQQSGDTAVAAAEEEPEETPEETEAAEETTGVTVKLSETEWFTNTAAANSYRRNKLYDKAAEVTLIALEDVANKYDLEAVDTLPKEFIKFAILLIKWIWQKLIDQEWEIEQDGEKKTLTFAEKMDIIGKYTRILEKHKDSFDEDDRQAFIQNTTKPREYEKVAITGLTKDTPFSFSDYTDDPEEEKMYRIQEGEVNKGLRARKKKRDKEKEGTAVAYVRKNTYKVGGVRGGISKREVEIEKDDGTKEKKDVLFITVAGQEFELVEGKKFKVTQGVERRGRRITKRGTEHTIEVTKIDEQTRSGDGAKWFVITLTIDGKPRTAPETYWTKVDIVEGIAFKIKDNEIDPNTGEEKIQEFDAGQFYEQLAGETLFEEVPISDAEAAAIAAAQAAEAAEEEAAALTEAKKKVMERIDKEGHWLLEQGRIPQAIEVAEDIEAKSKELLKDEVALKFGRFHLQIAIDSQKALLAKEVESFEAFTDEMDTTYEHFEEAEKYVAIAGGDTDATATIDAEKGRFVAVRVIGLDQYEITYETGALDPTVKPRMAEQLISLNADRRGILTRRGRGFGASRSVKVYFVPGDKVNGYTIAADETIISLPDIAEEDAAALAARQAEEAERRRIEEERAREEEERRAAEEAERLAAETREREEQERQEREAREEEERRLAEEEEARRVEEERVAAEQEAARLAAEEEEARLAAEAPYTDTEMDELIAKIPEEVDTNALIEWTEKRDDDEYHLKMTHFFDDGAEDLFTTISMKFDVDYRRARKRPDGDAKRDEMADKIEALYLKYFDEEETEPGVYESTLKAAYKALVEAELAGEDPAVRAAREEAQRRLEEERRRAEEERLRAEAEKAAEGERVYEVLDGMVFDENSFAQIADISVYKRADGSVVDRLAAVGFVVYLPEKYGITEPFIFPGTTDPAERAKNEKFTEKAKAAFGRIQKALEDAETKSLYEETRKIEKFFEGDKYTSEYLDKNSHPEKESWSLFKRHAVTQLRFDLSKFSPDKEEVIRKWYYEDKLKKSLPSSEPATLVADTQVTLLAALPDVAAGEPVDNILVAALKKDRRLSARDKAKIIYDYYNPESELPSYLTLSAINDEERARVSQIGTRINNIRRAADRIYRENRTGIDAIAKNSEALADDPNAVSFEDFVEPGATLREKKELAREYRRLTEGNDILRDQELEQLRGILDELITEDAMRAVLDAALSGGNAHERLVSLPEYDDTVIAVIESLDFNSTTEPEKYLLVLVNATELKNKLKTDGALRLATVPARALEVHTNEYHIPLTDAENQFVLDTTYQQYKDDYPLRTDAATFSSAASGRLVGQGISADAYTNPGRKVEAQSRWNTQFESAHAQLSNPAMKRVEAEYLGPGTSTTRMENAIEDLGKPYPTDFQAFAEKVATPGSDFETFWNFAKEDASTFAPAEITEAKLREAFDAALAVVAEEAAESEAEKALKEIPEEMAGYVRERVKAVPKIDKVALLDELATKFAGKIATIGANPLEDTDSETYQAVAEAAVATKVVVLTEDTKKNELQESLTFQGVVDAYKFEEFVALERKSDDIPNAQRIRGNYETLTDHYVAVKLEKLGENVTPPTGIFESTFDTDDPREAASGVAGDYKSKDELRRGWIRGKKYAAPEFAKWLFEQWKIADSYKKPQKPTTRQSIDKTFAESEYVKMTLVFDYALTNPQIATLVQNADADTIGQWIDASKKELPYPDSIDPAFFLGWVNQAGGLGLSLERMLPTHDGREKELREEKVMKFLKDRLTEARVTEAIENLNEAPITDMVATTKGILNGSIKVEDSSVADITASVFMNSEDLGRLLRAHYKDKGQTVEISPNKADTHRHDRYRAVALAAFEEKFEHFKGESFAFEDAGDMQTSWLLTIDKYNLTSYAPDSFAVFQTGGIKRIDIADELDVKIGELMTEAVTAFANEYLREAVNKNTLASLKFRRYYTEPEGNKNVQYNAESFYRAIAEKPLTDAEGKEAEALQYITHILNNFDFDIELDDKVTPEAQALDALFLYSGDVPTVEAWLNTEGKVWQEYSESEGTAAFVEWFKEEIEADGRTLPEVTDTEILEELTNRLRKAAVNKETSLNDDRLEDIRLAEHNELTPEEFKDQLVARVREILTGSTGAFEGDSRARGANIAIGLTDLLTQLKEDFPQNRIENYSEAYYLAVDTAVGIKVAQANLDTDASKWPDDQYNDWSTAINAYGLAEYLNALETLGRLEDFALEFASNTPNLQNNAEGTPFEKLQAAFAADARTQELDFNDPLTFHTVTGTVQKAIEASQRSAIGSVAPGPGKRRREEEAQNKFQPTEFAAATGAHATSNVGERLTSESGKEIAGRHDAEITTFAGNVVGYNALTEIAETEKTAYPHIENSIAATDFRNTFAERAKYIDFDGTSISYNTSNYFHEYTEGYTTLGSTLQAEVQNAGPSPEAQTKIQKEFKERKLLTLIDGLMAVATQPDKIMDKDDAINTWVDQAKIGEDRIKINEFITWAQAKYSLPVENLNDRTKDFIKEAINIYWRNELDSKTQPLRLAVDTLFAMAFADASATAWNTWRVDNGEEPINNYNKEELFRGPSGIPLAESFVEWAIEHSDKKDTFKDILTTQNLRGKRRGIADNLAERDYLVKLDSRDMPQWITDVRTPTTRKAVTALLQETSLAGARLSNVQNDLDKMEVQLGIDEQSKDNHPNLPVITTFAASEQRKEYFKDLATTYIDPENNGVTPGALSTGRLNDFANYEEFIDALGNKFGYNSHPVQDITDEFNALKTDEDLKKLFEEKQKEQAKQAFDKDALAALIENAEGLAKEIYETIGRDDDASTKIAELRGRYDTASDVPDQAEAERVAEVDPLLKRGIIDKTVYHLSDTVKDTVRGRYPDDTTNAFEAYKELVTANSYISEDEFDAIMDGMPEAERVDLEKAFFLEAGLDRSPNKIDGYEFFALTEQVLEDLAIAGGDIPDDKVDGVTHFRGVAKLIDAMKGESRYGSATKAELGEVVDNISIDDQDNALTKLLTGTGTPSQVKLALVMGHYSGMQNEFDDVLATHAEELEVYRLAREEGGDPPHYSEMADYLADLNVITTVDLNDIFGAERDAAAAVLEYQAVRLRPIPSQSELTDEDRKFADAQEKLRERTIFNWGQVEANVQSAGANQEKWTSIKTDTNNNFAEAIKSQPREKKEEMVRLYLTGEKDDEAVNPQTGYLYKYLDGEFDTTTDPGKAALRDLTVDRLRSTLVNESDIPASYLDDYFNLEETLTDYQKDKLGEDAVVDLVAGRAAEKITHPELRAVAEDERARIAASTSIDADGEPMVDENVEREALDNIATLQEIDKTLKEVTDQGKTIETLSGETTTEDLEENVIALAKGELEGTSPLDERLQTALDAIEGVRQGQESQIDEYVEQAYADIAEVLSRDPDAITDSTEQSKLRAAQFVLTDLLNKVTSDNGIIGDVGVQLEQIKDFDALQTAAYLAETYGEAEQRIDRILPEQLDRYFEDFVSEESNLEIFSRDTRDNTIDPVLDRWRTAPDNEKEERFEKVKQVLTQEILNLAVEKSKDAHVELAYRIVIENLLDLTEEAVSDEAKAEYLYVIGKLLTTVDIYKPTPKLTAKEKRQEKLDIKEADESIYQDILLKQQRGVDALSKTGRQYLDETDVDFSNFQHINPEAFNLMFDVRAGTFLTGEYVEKAAGSALGLFEAAKLGKKDTLRFGDLLIHEFYNNDLTPEDDNFRMPIFKDIGIQDPKTAERIFFRKYDALQAFVALQEEYADRKTRGELTDEWKNKTYMPAVKKAAKIAYGKVEYRNVPSSAKKLLEEGKIPGEILTQITSMDQYIINAYTVLKVVEEINEDIALEKLRAQIESGELDPDAQVMSNLSGLYMRDLSEERVATLRRLELQRKLYYAFETEEEKGNAYVPTFKRHELHTDGKLKDAFAKFGVEMNDETRERVLDGSFPGVVGTILSRYEKIADKLGLNEVEDPTYEDLIQPLNDGELGDIVAWIESISIGEFDGLTLDDADKALLRTKQVPPKLEALFAGLKDLQEQVEESERLEYPRRWMKESYLPSVRAALAEFNMPPLTEAEEKALMTKGVIPSILDNKMWQFKVVPRDVLPEVAKESWDPIKDREKIDRARAGLYIPEAIYEGNDDPRMHKDKRFEGVTSSTSIEDDFNHSFGPYDESMIIDNYEEVDSAPFMKSHESIRVSKSTRDAFIEGLKGLRIKVITDQKEVIADRKTDVQRVRKELKDLRADETTPDDIIDRKKEELAAAQSALTRAQQGLTAMRAQTTELSRYFRNHPEAIARVLYSLYGKERMRTNEFFTLYKEEVEIDGETVHRTWPILDMQQSIIDELFSNGGNRNVTFQGFLRTLEVRKPLYTQIRTTEQETRRKRNPFIPEYTLVMDQTEAVHIRIEEMLDQPDVQNDKLLAEFMEYALRIHEIRDPKKKLPTRPEMREGVKIEGVADFDTVSRDSLWDKWYSMSGTEKERTEFLDAKLEHGISSLLMIMSYPDTYDYATILDEDTVETLAGILHDLRGGRGDVSFGSSAIEYLQSLQDSEEPILTEQDFDNIEQLGEKELSTLATVIRLGGQYENDVIGLIEQKEAVFAKFETPELVGVNVADILRVQDRMFTARGKMLTPAELEKIGDAIQQQIDTYGIGTLRLSEEQYKMGENYENFRSLMQLANITDTNANGVIDGEEATVWVQQVVSQYNERIKDFLDPLLPEVMRDQEKMNEYLRTYAEIQLKKKELANYPFGAAYVALRDSIEAKQAAGEKVPGAHKRKLKRFDRMRGNNPDLQDQVVEADRLISEITALNGKYDVIPGSDETPLEVLDRVLYYGFVDIIMAMIQEDSQMATDFFISLGTENMNVTNKTAAFGIEVGHLLDAKENIHLFYGGIISPTPSTYVGISQTETDLGPRKRGELTVWASIGGGIGSVSEANGAPDSALFTIEAGIEHRTRFDDGRSVLGGIVGRIALGDPSATGFEGGAMVYGGVEHLRPEELEAMIEKERLEAAQEAIEEDFKRIDKNLESDPTIAGLPPERKEQVKQAIRAHVEGIIRKEAVRVAMPEVPRFQGIYWGFEASGTARGIARLKGHLYVRMAGLGQVTTTFEAGSASTLLEASDVRATQELTDRGITSGGFSSKVPMELETQEDIARLMEGEWEQMVASIGEVRTLYKSGHTMYTEEGEIAVTSWSMFDYATEIPTFEKVSEERMGEYQEAIDTYNEAIEEADIHFTQFGDDNLIAKLNIDKVPGQTMMYFEPEIRGLVTIADRGYLNNIVAEKLSPIRITEAGFVTKLRKVMEGYTDMTDAEIDAYITEESNKGLIDSRKQSMKEFVERRIREDNRNAILFDLSGNFPVIRKEVVEWTAERYGANTLNIFTFTSNPKKKRSEVAAASGEFLFIENHNDDVESAPVWKTTKHPDGRDTFGMDKLQGLGDKALEEEYKKREEQFKEAKALADEFDTRAGESVIEHEVLSEEQVVHINEVLDLFVPPETIDSRLRGRKYTGIKEIEPDITAAELIERRRLIEEYATISVFNHHKEKIEGRTLLDPNDIDFRDIRGGEAQKLILMIQDWYGQYAAKKGLSKTKLSSGEIRYVLNAMYYATFFNIHRGTYDASDYFVERSEVFSNTRNLSGPKRRSTAELGLMRHPLYQPMRNYLAHLRGSAHDMATGMATTYVDENLEEVQADFPGKSREELIDIITEGLIAKMYDIPARLVTVSEGEITPDEAREYTDYLVYYNMSKNGYDFSDPRNAEDIARRKVRVFSDADGRRIRKELMKSKVQRAFYKVYEERFNSKLDRDARAMEKLLPATASARSFRGQDEIDTPEGPKKWYVEGGRGSVTLAPEFGDDDKEDQAGGMRYTKVQDIHSDDPLEKHTSRTIFEYVHPRLELGKEKTDGTKYNPSQNQFFIEYGTKNIVGQIRSFDETKAQEKADAKVEAKETYNEIEISYLDAKQHFAQNFGINIVKWAGLILPDDEDNTQATRLQELFWKVYDMNSDTLKDGLEANPNDPSLHLTTEEKETFTEFINLMTIFQELEYFDYKGDDEAFNMIGFGGDDYEVQIRYVPVDVLTNGTEELIAEAKERLENATDDAMFKQIAEEYLSKHSTLRRSAIEKKLEELDTVPEKERKISRIISTLEEENKPEFNNETIKPIAGEEQNVVPFAFISKIGDNGERSKPIILNVSAIAFQATFPKCGNWLVGANTAFTGGMMTIKPPEVPEGPRGVKIITRDTHTTDEDMGYGTLSGGGALGVEVPAQPEDPPGERTGENKENEEGNDGADQDNPDVPDQTRPVGDDDPEDPERTTRLTDEERTPKFVGDARLGSIGKPSRGGITIEREHEIEEKDERAQEDEDDTP